jgi:hypothetical protein
MWHVERDAGGVLVEESDGKNHLVRARSRWDDSIETDGTGWTRLTWPTIRTGGGLLWTRWWTFRFHKMREISWLAERRYTNAVFIAHYTRKWRHPACRDSVSSPRSRTWDAEVILRSRGIGLRKRGVAGVGCGGGSWTSASQLANWPFSSVCDQSRG